MKKLAALVLMLLLALSVTACGGRKQSVTYTLEEDTDGLKMTDSMKLDAKGDTVWQMEETITLDMTGFDEDTQALMTKSYDALTESYQAVEGVECTGAVEDGIYTIRIRIDTTGNAVSKLMDQGLLRLDGDTSTISLEKTAESLEANGYTKEK